jgi:recombinational DNA repair protein RecR
MDKISRKSALKEFQQIPGVGIKTAEDFWKLGIFSVKDLDGRDPERLYQKLCRLKQTKIDRCQLYVFRCAVYYASHKKPKPELLKWWNWKGGRSPRCHP